MTNRRRSFLGLAIVCAAAAILLLVRLGQPDWTPPWPRSDAPLRYLWDECYYAFTAHRSVLGDQDRWTMNVPVRHLAKFDPTDIGPHVGMSVYHPPLTTFVVSLSSRILGWSPFAVRLPGALCGVTIVAGTWLFARRARGDRAAFIAAGLVLSDGVWFTISRVTIPHVYVTAATTLAAVAALAAWQDDARRARFTLAAGALCGLGLAFKTSALSYTVLFAAILLVRAWKRGADGSRPRGLIAWAVAFLLLPPAIYLASWTPFFVVWDRSWDEFVTLHRQMRAWHASMPAELGPSSPWWTWPVVWKPVPMLSEVGPGEVERKIVTWGNPFLWWAAAAAVPWAAVRWWRTRDAADGFTVAGWLVAWVVFAGVTRFGFAYYILPAAPYAALSVASAIEEGTARDPRARRVVGIAWLALAAAAFAITYPELSAVGRVRT